VRAPGGSAVQIAPGVSTALPRFAGPAAILRRVLPNLIVIGAAKCGTTALHRYLDLHPEISMSRVKEPGFFCSSENMARRHWYEGLFEPAKVRGESSPSYTNFPSNRGVPERMASLVPDIRMVYLVRDPVERTITQYRFGRWVAGYDYGTIEDALSDLENSPIVRQSRYAYQLEQYLPVFPMSSFCIVESRDLRNRPEETLRRIFGFLEVDDSFTTVGFSQPHYQTDATLPANRVGRQTRALAYRVLGRRRARFLQERLPGRLQSPFLKKVEIPTVELDPALRAKLEAYFRQDADRLRSLTGQQFETWSV
jgi:hypothetical protein